MATTENNQTLLLFMLAVAVALMVVSCAPVQPTSPTGPRGNEPVYPVLLAEDSARRETAQAAFARLRQSVTTVRNGAANESIALDLSPITATIQSLPAVAGGGVYLPKVGVAAEMNEEETRESLRRFLRDWREVIGADPARLSLVDHTVQPDGSSLVNYDQRPFRFPLRGNYGKLQIRFASDRRVLSIFSSCIPDADKVRSALRGLGASGALSARLTAEDAMKKLRENDASSSPSASPAVRLPAGAQMKPHELVTHVQPSKTRADALAFRIAWEIEISNAPIKLAYIDAISGELIAAE